MVRVRMWDYGRCCYELASKVVEQYQYVVFYAVLREME